MQNLKHSLWCTSQCSWTFRRPATFISDVKTDYCALVFDSHTYRRWRDDDASYTQPPSSIDKNIVSSFFYLYVKVHFKRSLFTFLFIICYFIIIKNHLYMIHEAFVVWSEPSRSRQTVWHKKMCIKKFPNHLPSWI